MNYVLDPSLQQVILVKIATDLWDRDDLKLRICKFGSFLAAGGDFLRKWVPIEHQVLKKASSLSLPKPLKNSLLSIIRPIGLEMLSWWEYHNLENDDFVLTMPDKFCWTLQGTVDRKKTAELLVNNEKLDIERRYKLACVYCLENQIRALWKLIPEQRQALYYENNNARGFDSLDLIAYWTCTTQGQTAKLDQLIARRSQRYDTISAEHFAFNCATWSGNLVATQHFFENFLVGAIEVDLAELVSRVAGRRRLPKGNMDTLFFLLSQMSGEQQVEDVKEGVGDVLKCLIDWPWQPFFLETAVRGWEHLTWEEFGKVLSLIARKIKNGFKDYDYVGLFVEFWKLCPEYFIELFFEGMSAFLTINYLFEAGEEEIVKLMLNQAITLNCNIEDLIFTREEPYKSRTIIHAEKWNLLKFLMDESLIPENIIVECKRRISLRVFNWVNARLKFSCDKFISIVNNYIQNESKRRRLA